MKFIHIGDIHLGAVPDAGNPKLVDRKKEIYDSFYHIIDLCNEKDIDLLLIAGDLFHKQPLLRELKEINYIFDKLIKTQVVLIAGNHDYISVRSNYTGFTWNEKVHMLYEEEVSSVYIEELNTEIFGFSYHTRDVKEAKVDNVLPRDKGRINLLLSHGGSINDVPMNKKKILSNGFDYVALGHIHIPEIIEGRMAYSGSLEPLDKTEIGPRGYILGEISKDGMNSNLKLDFIPHSKREYIRIEIEVDVTTTNVGLRDMVKRKIQELGDKYLYLIDIIGFKDPDIIFTIEDLYSTSNIIEINQLAVPDYDFDALYHDNYDNIIGQYIKQIGLVQSVDSDISKKALYYGISALLSAKL
jgi:exonuclease SbcD